MAEQGANIERKIIIGLIVSDEFTRKIYPLFKHRFLKSKTARTLASWCLEYYESYEKAPGQDIETIYTSKLQAEDPGTREQEDAEWIEGILDSLSGEWKEQSFNIDYYLDLTEQYFSRRQLEIYTEDIQGEILTGNLEEAKKLASNYKPVELPKQTGSNPFLDKNEIQEAFEDDVERVVEFPGALGYMLNDQLGRDCFVSLMGPEKRGKTWILMEIMFRALKNGKNVVFFQAGDMSRKQFTRRMATWIAKKSYKNKYCSELFVPTLDCLHNQLDNCPYNAKPTDQSPFASYDKKSLKEITHHEAKKTFENYEKTYEVCRACQKNMGPVNFPGAIWYERRESVTPLSWGEAYKRGYNFMRRNGAKFKLFCYPSGTLTIQEMETQLEILEKQENLVPDVIITDYADILAPNDTRKDARHQINQLWMDQRSLSQKWHCLYATATQADAASYRQDSVKPWNFTEDKRKLGHVTSMYSLNQTPEEKRRGIMRLGEIVVREDDFSIDREVHILQRLELGRPCLGSFFM